MSEQLDAALREAKKYLRATDDPRNWDGDQVLINLVVAYIEAAAEHPGTPVEASQQETTK